mmetsp:Transcript_60931/g.176282  ORF Transcript_60931/g.176282 Transcript_60931/m.176282 type:complete len:322 (-) Transcript_60931:679-1644(-)
MQRGAIEARQCDSERPRRACGGHRSLNDPEGRGHGVRRPRIPCGAEVTDEQLHSGSRNRACSRRGSDQLLQRRNEIFVSLRRWPCRHPKLHGRAGQLLYASVPGKVRHTQDEAHALRRRHEVQHGGAVAPQRQTHVRPNNRGKQGLCPHGDLVGRRLCAKARPLLRQWLHICAGEELRRRPDEPILSNQRPGLELLRQLRSCALRPELVSGGSATRTHRASDGKAHIFATVPHVNEPCVEQQAKRTGTWYGLEDRARGRRKRRKARHRQQLLQDHQACINDNLHILRHGLRIPGQCPQSGFGAAPIAGALQRLLQLPQRER